MFIIAVFVAGVARIVNIVTEHGMLNIQQLGNYAMSYIENISRVSQNAYHIYKALMVSVSK